jgi:hypothetical protein
MRNTIEAVIKDSMGSLEAAVLDVRDALIDLLEEYEKTNKNYISTKVWELARLECIHARGEARLTNSEEVIRAKNLKSSNAFIEVMDSLHKRECLTNKMENKND